MTERGDGVEGAGAAPWPWWVGAIVHLGSDGHAAFDRNGTLVYANAAADEIMRVPPGGLLGRSIVDLVHPDDLGRAAEVVTGVVGGARPRPGFVQLVRGDGSSAQLQVSLADLDQLPGPPDGPGPLTAITLRDNSLQDAHWQFLSALTGGEPFHEAVAGLAHGLSEHPDGPMGVAYDEPSGRRAVAGPLAPELAGMTRDGRFDDTPGTPWAEAVRSGAPTCTAIADLPAGLRERASTVGAACVVVPVPDPAHVRPALIVQWPADAAMGGILTEALVRRPRQAVMLALERRDTIERLERLALEDPLTGVANRHRLFERLDALAADGTPYGICYLDLDRFKAANDAWGHRAGDAVLTAVARRLEALAGPDDVVARLGGDEFAVACPGVTAEGVDRRAAAIVDALAAPVWFDEQEVPVGATVGCAVSAPGDRPDEVVAAADAALYAAKRAGRGSWRRG